MFYLRIFLNKEFYLSTIRTLFLNTIDKQKKRRPLSLLYFSMCAGHGMSSVGDKPTTGSYRQV